MSENNETNIIREIEVNLESSVENDYRKVNEAMSMEGVDNPNLRKHLRNIERLKSLYYDKEVFMYYNIYCDQVRNDDTLTSIQKDHLLQALAERNNARVNSGQERIEVLKALDMYTLYKRNGKSIDMDFLSDVKLRHILESRDLAIEFIEILTNKKICTIYYDYWTHMGAVYAYDGISALTVLPNLQTSFRALYDLGMIDEKILNGLCDLAKKKLTMLNVKYKVEGY